MKNHNILLTILGITLILGAIIGISYALGELTFFGDENNINTGTIDFVYKEPTSDITITNIILTDEEAKTNSNYFAFTVNAKATGTLNIGYYIYYTPVGTNTLPLENIKLYLTKLSGENDPIASEITVFEPKTLDTLTAFDITTLTADNTETNFLIHSSYFTFNNTPTYQYHYYRLRIWDNDTSSEQGNIIEEDGNHSYIIGGLFKMKINVFGHNGMPVSIS